MTPNAAIAILKWQLGNWQGTQLDSGIVNEMNAAVRRLERGPELPWFLHRDTDQADTNLTISANTEVVALPSDFLREDEEADITPLFRYDASQTDVWTPVYKKDYSKIKQENPGTGTLYYYDIIGNNIYVRHVPTSNTTLRLLYFRKDSEITAGTTETLWLANAPDLIIAEAGIVIAGQYVKDYEAEKRFIARASQEKALLMNENIARIEAGYKRSMGDD